MGLGKNLEPVVQVRPLGPWGHASWYLGCWPDSYRPLTWYQNPHVTAFFKLGGPPQSWLCSVLTTQAGPPGMAVAILIVPDLLYALHFGEAGCEPLPGKPQHYPGPGPLFPALFAPATHDTAPLFGFVACESKKWETNQLCPNKGTVMEMRKS